MHSIIIIHSKPWITNEIPVIVISAIVFVNHYNPIVQSNSNVKRMKTGNIAATTALYECAKTRSSNSIISNGMKFNTVIVVGRRQKLIIRSRKQKKKKRKSIWRKRSDTRIRTKRKTWTIWQNCTGRSVSNSVLALQKFTNKQVT